MNQFRKYLELKDLVLRTVNLQEKQVKAYLDWLPISIEDSTYKHLMDYVGHLQKNKRPIHHINKSLQAISHYYDFKELPNVAINTRLKGRVQKVALKAISSELMDELYDQFEVQDKKNYFHHSDKIILGLMIYQGLELGDFMALELKDIDLEKGTIYIPQRGQKISRTIQLKSHQILQFHNYIIGGREQYKVEESYKLFSPQCDDYHQLHWQLKRLSKHVKKEAKIKLDLTIAKLNHLRQSRITIWIKQEGLRKAQYLSGFRTILSVERYRHADMEDLKEQVKMHHPFK